MLLKELALKLGYKNKNSFIVYCKRNFPFIYKTQVERKQKGRGGKIVTITRKIWAVDDAKIDVIKNHLASLKTPKPNHNRLHSWTRTAIECYEAKLICQNCPNYMLCKELKQNYGQKHMKNKTIELVRVLGRPPERINEE